MFVQLSYLLNGISKEFCVFFYTRIIKAGNWSFLSVSNVNCIACFVVLFIKNKRENITDISYWLLFFFSGGELGLFLSSVVGYVTIVTQLVTGTVGDFISIVTLLTTIIGQIPICIGVRAVSTSVDELIRFGSNVIYCLSS